MIRFFRTLRHRLLSENRASRYLLYAVGEIILVVVGILIALQINTWNERQKEGVLEAEYLQGIRENLAQDVEQARWIIKQNIIPLNIVHRLVPGLDIDYSPRHELATTFTEPSVDTTDIDFWWLWVRGDSFRPMRSTYNSLIADGKSHLITNKALFQKIQNFYDSSNSRIQSLFDVIKDIEVRLATTYAYEKFHWDYRKLMEPGNERIRADLASFWQEIMYYCHYLDFTIVEMESIIREIDAELQK